MYEAYGWAGILNILPSELMVKDIIELDEGSIYIDSAIGLAANSV